MVMSFELTNAPATFQSLINQVFRPFLRRFVLVFFDDILVYSPYITKHERHLGMVFATPKDYQPFAIRKKCVIGHSRIQYLGLWISSRGGSGWRKGSDNGELATTQGCIKVEGNPSANQIL